MDNINWGAIDVLGKIVVYPNLDYIAPLESFTTWGNHSAIKINRIYKGESVGYIIDPMNRINLPIDFEFMPELELEEFLLPKKTTSIKRNNFYTYDDNSSSWEDIEDWEDLRLDVFEGDENNYWNIE